MAKAVTLAFCSIQEHFVKDIRAKFGIPNFPQSPDIEQNSVLPISRFLVNPLKGKIVIIPEPVTIFT